MNYRNFLAIFFINIFYILPLLATDPIVYIWDEKPERYGHVGIGTQNFYASMWPQQDIDKSNVGQMFTKGGVPGKISVTPIYDGISEARVFDESAKKPEKPKQYTMSGLSYKKIEEVYIDFLEFNNITPDNVCIKTVKEKENLYFAKLSKTLYSFASFPFQLATHMNIKDVYKLRTHTVPMGVPVIKHPDYIPSLSCTSFLQIMLRAADNDNFVWLQRTTEVNDLRPAITVPETKHIVDTYCKEGKYIDTDIHSKKDDCIIF